METQKQTKADYQKHVATRFKKSEAEKLELKKAKAEFKRTLSK
jgi:hypothetical protein